MADDTLTIDFLANITRTGTGDQKRVEPGQKTVASLSLVHDAEFTIIDTDAIKTIWDTALAGQPATWELAILVLLTAGTGVVGVEITGDAISLALPLTDKLPMCFGNRDAGDAADTLDGKITKLEIDTTSTTELKVRLLLYGPEA